MLTAQAPVAQWIRAPDYGSGGRGFESLRACDCGGEGPLQGRRSVLERAFREVMGLLRKVAQFRERQILEHAEPFLDEGETVLAWVRTTRPRRSSRGFLFVTPKRVIVSWARAGQDDNIAVSWDEIVSWGMAPDGGRGPLFAIETESGCHQGHILVRTEGMVTAANKFLVHFVEHAPQPSRALRRVEHPASYRSNELAVERERKTVGKHTRRAIVTIIGLCLIVVAFLIGWIPGPWSIPLVIAGLAVLATEYDWADDFLRWSRARYESTKAKLKARGSTAK